MKQKFSRNLLLNLIGEEYGEVPEELELISDEIVGHGRWSIYHDIVFRYRDQYYMSRYSTGATEYQDEYPWQYEGNEIECTEVKPALVTVTKYVPVEAVDGNS